MKFLVDVNLSKKKNFLDEHPNLENVRDKIDGKVSDKKLIKYAVKHDYTHKTRNVLCML